MEKDTLLVYSGGLDSTTLLWEYAPRIALAVNFSYGSNHNEREAECARWQCRKAGIELIEIPLAFMGRYFRSALLEGPDAIPDGEYAGDNMTSTVVPFRNGIMLSIAAGLAESRGLSHVMMANHSGDHEVYPDCRPAFVDAMSAAISAGTYAAITLLAPYTDLTKAEIALRGLRLGVDYDRGTPEPCGRCATCREREAALAEARRMFEILPQP